MSQVPNDVLLGSTGSTHPVQQIHDIFRFIPWAVQPEESLQVAVLFAQRSGPRPKTRAQTRGLRHGIGTATPKGQEGSFSAFC